MTETLKPIPMKIVNDAEGAREAEIMLYEPIGDDGWMGGLSAKTFAENLKALGPLDKITCRVNCPGGDVFDGLAIMNTLKQHKAQVTMQIDGLAASAASYVVQAASPGKLFMAENALMMIHRAAGGTFGNSDDHMKTAEILEKLDDTIAGTYAARSGRRAETFLKMMDEETWMTAQEAIDHKLADAMTPAKKMAACFDLKLLNRYKHTPADIAARLLEIGGDEVTLRDALDIRDAAIAKAVAAKIDREIMEPLAAGTAGLDLGDGKDFSPAQPNDSEAVAVRLRLLELEDVA